METETPWRYNIKELMKKDTHSVPESVLKNMKKNWETNFTIENVLNSKAPWEK